MIACRPRSIARWTLCAMLIGGLGATAARGADFRVDNRVYAGLSAKPDSRSATIFAGRLVYDFLEDPAEIVVFDKAAGRFALLDVRRQVQTALTIQEVVAFVAQIKQRAAVHNDPQIHFLAQPRFEESASADGAELTLKSPWMSYRVQLASADPEVASQYREFSDWYVQLNTVLNPGARPPFARLLVNEALARRQAIAREVQLTLPAKKSTARPVNIRSQHELVVPPSEEDLQRTAQARQSMQTFRMVTFEEYRKKGTR